MIELKNIHKSFHNTNILKDVSLEFKQGSVNIIIGQSGSGKTVMLKCLVGLYEVDQGGVIYGGQNFTRMNLKERKEIRKEIGMLFQGSALFDSQTVEQNVIFPLSMFTNMSEEEKLDRANFCLKRVDLINSNNKYPAEISGGMKKRVAIARAIAMNPKYLFCDEPNSGLDPATSILIDNLIKEITEEYNITTVVITHDMNSVIEIGENIAFLHKGQIAWKGDKNEILRSENKILNDFVYASSFMKKVRESMIKNDF